MIKRGSRMFLQLGSIGECDDKGKTVLSVGYKSKAVAEPDRPMMLIIGLVEEVASMARYSSAEAARVDVERLIEVVTRLRDRIEAPADLTPPPASPSPTLP